MKKLIAPLAAAAVMLVACSPSLRDADPSGFEACTMLDKARDKATDSATAMSLIIFDIGGKARSAKTESIRAGVGDSPEISKLSKTPAYSVKDSLAQTCRDLGVPVREVTKSP